VMRQLLALTLFFLAYQFSFGQACGIYRIEYFGNITTTDKQIVKVYLPTTMLLHNVEKEQSKQSFIETNLTNGIFKIEVSSHLTTPYNNIDQLIAFYKKQSDIFKMKVSYSENGTLKEKIIEIDWDKIEVTIIEDGKFGTLFRFAFKDLAV
jgi:hypothetical protein